MLPYHTWTRYSQSPLAHNAVLRAYPHTKHARALHTSSTADQPQLPEWVVPPPPDRGRQRSHNARAERRQSYSLQRIRSCYTLEELAAVVDALQASSSPHPALVIQAAVQAPRAVAWPAAPRERAALQALMGELAAMCAMHLERYDLEQLAALAGACARARVVPRELLLPLQLRLAADAKRGLTQDALEHLATMSDQLSRLGPGGPGGVRAPRLWEALARAALAALGRHGGRDRGSSSSSSSRGEPSPAHLAELLGGFARVGMGPGGLAEAEEAMRGLLGRAVECAARQLPEAKPQDVATLMWALARLRHHPPPRLLDALTAHVSAAAAAPSAPLPAPVPNTQSFSSAATVAAFAPRGGGGAPYRLLQLAAVAGACAKLDVRQRHPLWGQLAAAGVQALHQEACAVRGEAAAPVFLHGGGPAGAGSPRAVGAAGDGGGSSSPTATSQAVAVLCTALAGAGAASTQLLRAAAELIVEMARGGSEDSRERSGTASWLSGEERVAAGAAGGMRAAEQRDEAAGALGAAEAAVAGGPAAGLPPLPRRVVGLGHVQELAAVLQGAGLQEEADAVMQACQDQWAQLAGCVVQERAGVA